MAGEKPDRTADGATAAALWERSQAAWLALKDRALDVAAGEIVRCQRRFGLFTSRTPDPAHATFHFEADTVRLAPASQASRAVPGPGFHPCDVTHNFFVGRVDMLVTEIDRHGQELVNLISAEALEDRRSRPPRVVKTKKAA